jgi:hypothetical protein
MKEQVSNQINDDFREQFTKIENREDFFDYKQVLHKELSSGRPRFDLLFEYGISRLPKDDNGVRPNEPLAYFFLIVSEINGVPRDLRSLAIDAMLYCESDKDTVVPTSFEKIKKDYTEIQNQLL